MGGTRDQNGYSKSLYMETMRLEERKNHTATHERQTLGKYFFSNH